jgi:hypothetical protein
MYNKQCWSDVAVVELVEVARTCEPAVMQVVDVIAGVVVRCVDSSFYCISEGVAGAK